MRNRIDIPILITGIALTGVAVPAGLLAAGYRLAEPITVWFAGALLLAGFVGLAMSLRRNSRDGR